MFLNPLVTHRAKEHPSPGFYTKSNAGSADYEWPPKQDRIKGHNFVPEDYRCNLQNSGPTNLGQIVMAAKIYYGKNRGDDFDVHPFEINPLAAGSRHTFYIVNQCPMNAAVILSDHAELHVVGETERRQVPVSGPSGMAIIDKVLMFSPSGYRFPMPCSEEDKKRLMEQIKKKAKRAHL